MPPTEERESEAGGGGGRDIGPVDPALVDSLPTDPPAYIQFAWRDKG